MEINNVLKNIDRSYYLTKGENDFIRLKEIINLMASFQLGKSEEYEIYDMFLETPEYFLKQLDASVRIRRVHNKQTLTIICNELGKKREFEMEMDYNSKVTDKIEYILFLEDKIQDIYTHRIDVDVVRVLHGLRPFLIINTKRKAYEILNNKEFKAELDLDITNFEAKRNTETLYIVELKNNCYLTKENEETFEKFAKELEKRVVMIPMGEKKLDAGMRVVKRDW